MLCLLLLGCGLQEGIPTQFKFVSSGQAVADAATFTQVLHGNSLKPLAPVNLRVYRDSNGAALIECTRRTRIAGGLRPNIGVAINEEAAIFDFEIYSGSTLKRTIRVNISDSEIPIWRKVIDPDSAIAISADGTIQITDVADANHPYAVLVSNQVLRADDPEVVFAFTGDTRIDGTTTTPLPLEVGFVSASLSDDVLDDGNPVAAGFALRDPIAFAPTTRIVLDSLLVAPDLPQLATTRLAIRMTRGTINLYQDAVGPYDAAPNLGSQTMQGSGFYRVCVFHRMGSLIAGHVMTVTSPRLTRQDPTALYSVADQTTDFGSAQSSIKIRAYQVSAIVGRGAYVEGTL